MKYLISNIIILICFGGIVQGIYLLYLLNRLPDVIALVLVVTMEVIYLYAIGLSAQKYLMPMFKRGGV